MARLDVGLLVLVNPVSLRYAADWREYALFQSHIPTYYLYVPAEGPLLMQGAYRLQQEVIEEFRPAHYLSCFDGELDLASNAAAFSREVNEAAGGGRVAIERLGLSAQAALEGIGVSLLDAEPPTTTRCWAEARPVRSAAMHSGPDYGGGSLVNLIAELETRMVGTSPTAGLHDGLSAAVDTASSYVVVLFDGLGFGQVDPELAPAIAGSLAGPLDAPFPSTTSVSLASIATARAPGEHGLIGHHLRLDSTVFNSLKWRTLTGETYEADPVSFIASPNLWERLSAGGWEPITVQSGGFVDTPLTKALYRGCRFEPVWDYRELIDAVVHLADQPGRFIFTYVADVDFAAHLFGQRSQEYRDALSRADWIWTEILRRAGEGVAVIGTADHGHIDYPATGKIEVRSRRGLVYFGDPRALYVSGPPDEVEALSRKLPARAVRGSELLDLLGGDAHMGRVPDVALLADPGHLLLPGSMDRRLIGYHGGLEEGELRIPLLTG